MSLNDTFVFDVLIFCQRATRCTFCCWDMHSYAYKNIQICILNKKKSHYNNKAHMLNEREGCLTISDYVLIGCLTISDLVLICVLVISQDVLTCHKPMICRPCPLQHGHDSWTKKKIWFFYTPVKWLLCSFAYSLILQDLSTHTHKLPTLFSLIYIYIYVYFLTDN